MHVRPSINDVAARAGVGRNTVSRVINGLNWVAPETREKVLQAIQELGYQRNTLAGGLRTGRTHTIGMLIADILNPLFATEARGVQDAADAADHQVILCNTDGDPSKEQRLLATLAEKQVDGAIVIPCDSESASRLEAFQHANRPVVALNRAISGFDSVTFSVVSQMEQAIHFLVAGGHRRIGLITPPLETSTIREGVDRYQAILAQHSIEYLPRYIRAVPSEEFAGREAARQLLALPDRPTAIFAAAGRLTLGAVAAVREANLRIPNDIDLVGCNVAHWSRIVDPPLTLIQTDPYQLGQRAGELLLRRMRGDHADAPVHIRQAAVLETRESLARASELASPRVAVQPVGVD